MTFKFHTVLYAALSPIFMENVFHTMVIALTDKASVCMVKRLLQRLKLNENEIFIFVGNEIIS